MRKGTSRRAFIAGTAAAALAAWISKSKPRTGAGLPPAGQRSGKEARHYIKLYGAEGSGK